MEKKASALLFGLLCVASMSFSQPLQDRWKIQPDNSITWFVGKNDVHSDHIEMSGRYISAVLRFGVDRNGAFTLNKSLYFPMLRTVPNDTFGSLHRHLNWNLLDLLEVNCNSLGSEEVESVTTKGYLKVESNFTPIGKKIHVVRTIFPSPDKPALLEIYRLTNTGKDELTLEVPSYKSVIETEADKGVNGNVYTIVSTIDRPGTYHLKKGESIELAASNTACLKGQTLAPVDADKELQGRMALVDQWMNRLVLETPDSIINTMFAFSKIRACESIYQTKGGPMHGPGGEAYYAAIWANDQGEYISPYFPFVGYDYGNKSALNAYTLFSHYMNPQYNPIPSSIIAEGIDIWNGAGDRGDAAMLAYGASRYVLARGDKSEALQLWPLIQWCLEYCHRKLNAEGAVKSDHDELEGRFPAGEANLNTSSLYYDALVSATYLNEELGGKKSLTDLYRSRALQMRKNIDKYFAHEMEGYDTYAYYKGNDKLRAWICTPLVMGITERAKGTIEALFSKHLWTENGLLSEEGSETFWDRSTLYALRGAITVGETEKALAFLKYYSEKRLLGEHVPYAIEAWPEGSQRHLSAESGLYGRIFTEALFGIRPTGLHQFTLTPRLPKEWNKMALRKIGAFAANFDVEVNRIAAGKLNVVVKNNGKVVLKKHIHDGASLTVKL
jgi:hypothetical protein